MTFPIFPYFYTKILNNLEQFLRKPPRFEGTKINSFNYPKDHSLVRAVNKFLSSRLIMNNRRLWNLHQRHKFVRAKASRYILKCRVSEIVFPEVFMPYFPLRTPCCFVKNTHKTGNDVIHREHFMESAGVWYLCTSCWRIKNWTNERSKPVRFLI